MVRKQGGKVLFIMHFPPPVHGASMIGEYIRKSQFINSSFDTKYINLGTSVSVDEIGKGGLVKLIRYVRLIFNVIWSLVNFRPKLVYLTLTASGPGFYKDALVSLIVKAIGFKVIYHFHNKGIKENSDSWLNDLLYKLLFRKSAVILLSKNLFKDVEKYVNRKQVYICPNGIPKIEFSCSENKVTREILFLSNLIKSKGILVLLNACQILKERNVDFHCSLVGGEGDLSENDLRNVIKGKGLENNVEYLGKQYGQDKNEIYKKASVFVFPTFYPKECFPLVLLEAMQFSLPIVTTSEGGIEAIVEDGRNGFIIPKKDPISLADKLQLLLEHADLAKEMGGEGKIRFNENFTFQNFETRILFILQNVLTKI